MNVRSLNIDFYRRRYFILTAPGISLFILGIAAIGTVATLHSRTLETIQALEAPYRDHIQAQDPKSLPSSTPLSPKEAARMRTIVKQLNLPWDRFFKGIESAAGNGIVFLKVHSNSKDGTLRIDGEARTLYSVLQCIRAMNTGGVFTDALLVSHEIDPKKSTSSVRFTLSTRWIAE